MDKITDGIKDLLLAGIGAVATTAEKSSQLLDELVKKGELTVDQGKALNQELKHKAEEARASAKEPKKEETKDMDAYVDSLSAEELNALKAKIAAAEARKEE